MTAKPDCAEQDSHLPGSLPAEELDTRVRDVLRHAVDAHQKNIEVYKSLRNLNEVVGTEYGDRVLYELVQNAHDAHQASDQGRIAVKLVVRSDTEGALYVANGGVGFHKRDVDAIVNLATTTKEIGEGIGNKGLGFRSIEALTDDVRIFSRTGRRDSARFNGYCFRFASVKEIEYLLHADGYDAATARDVASTVPRYLVPLPLAEQPDEVTSFARRGYATVVVVPLRTTDAIELAKRQTWALADFDVPLLLFLDRIAEFRIDAEASGEPTLRRRLSRRQTAMDDIPCVPDCRMHDVRVGEDRRFLVVQHEVDKQRVLDAVEQSVSRAPQLKRWLEWKGQPTVSVAVSLSRGAVTTGRLYNFLPMGEAAAAPLLGHLDGPFFAGIDRRDADFDLPLNATLMNAAAEACAQAALHIARSADTQIPQRSVFDLIAWTGPHATKLDAAFENMGTSLGDAPVVPVIPFEGNIWANLSKVCVWPAGDFSPMKGAEVVKRTSARLVSADIEGDRLLRLNELARRQHHCLPPSGQQLAQWCEHFARSLADHKAAPRTWSRFYDDLPRVFGAAGEDLKELVGRSIILDRSKKLRLAGRGGPSSEASVFVRNEASRGKRARHRVPLPPATLARRYRFIDEKIRLRQDTLGAFLKAGLVREYDPVEALEGLASALGAEANENRRREALTWAFKVWVTADADIGNVLQHAELQVPTLSGWRSATEAAFSSSWTPVGQIVENFLVEASEASADCRRAQKELLVDFDDWPTVTSNTKRQWIDFLKLLGVADGLRPVEGITPESDYGHRWQQLVNTGDATEGLDDDWCREAEASNASFRYPYTMYSRKGAAWRLPGQIEHGELPDTAKEALQELVFLNLKMHGAKHLTFDVGRFERSSRHVDQQTLPTPLAVFLRCSAWIATGTHEDPEFRKPSQCWAGHTRSSRPPRFMHRVPDAVASLVESSEEFADLVFGDTVGLRDWHSKDTAAERLQALATVSPALATHYRRDFRREYRSAWLDFSETTYNLPASLALAVTRDGGLEKLEGDAANPATVILTQNVDTFEARILLSAGHVLLEIGDAPGNKIAERLSETGLFVPRLLDGRDVRLLVDGKSFTPSTGDPLLTTFELEWLPELVMLGHRMLAEGLERGIQPTTIERRIRAIRVRRCQTITLVVDETSPSSKDSLERYGFEDSGLPTLILSNRMPLSWTTLSQDLSRTISKLIDSRLRFLEPLLLRLAALRQVNDTLDAPTDDALARALQCDFQTLQEHRAALRTDIKHILHLIVPVIAYFGDVTLARKLESDAEEAGAAFDILRWLRARSPVPKSTPEDLIEVCGKASDRAAVRRALGLDYERFNRVLLDLGEPPPSNEAELRYIYKAYLQQMYTDVLKRLRRHHAADFQDGRDLKAYVDRKTLAFLEFDHAWILTKETLDKVTVEAHVERLLNKVLGEDREVDLPPWRGLLENNRKSLRAFAIQAPPVVQAWCRRNGVLVCDPWHSEDPQSIVRCIENSGLLDFDLVADAQIPELCFRAVCWPEGMPRTLDLTALGLDATTVEEEERQRKRKRDQRIVERRSIDFAGTTLDTGDPSFVQAFLQLAEDSIAADQSWWQRSRRPKLAEFPETGDSGPPPGGGSGGGRGRRRQPPEDLKKAMGLASEWLAFQYLRCRYPEAIDETCWVSGNRVHFFGGSEGNDAAGYDLCVKTPKAEWLYEVKSSLDDTQEFELTPNEMRVAARVTKRGRRRYRILYVPYVFTPERWLVLELPNPMGEETRKSFRQVGHGAVRFRFEHPTAHT